MIHCAFYAIFNTISLQIKGSDLWAGQKEHLHQLLCTMESPTEAVTWRCSMSCAIEHGKETQKHYLPSKIKVSGNRTNFTQLECLAPCFSEGRAAQLSEHQITHRHLRPPLQLGAMSGTAPVSMRATNSGWPRLSIWFLVRYGNCLISWLLETPYFRSLALQQLSTFKEPEVPVYFEDGTEVLQLPRCDRKDSQFRQSDYLMFCTKSRRPKELHIFRFHIMKERVIQR